MKHTFAIGIDAGGTNLKAGLVSRSGKIIKLVEGPTDASLGKRKIAQNVISLVNELLITNSSVAGIGLGWPATVHVPLAGKKIKEILERNFRLPVFLDNDAKYFTYAEALLGAGKKYSIVLGITLGTGVGSGLVINRKIYHGRGVAPELGHITIDYQGPKCACGDFGCLEEFVAKRGVARLAKKYDLSKKDGYGLYLLAKKGNKKALLVWKKMGQLLGIGLVNIINSFDPEIIILGGKISKAWKFFFPEIRKEVQKNRLVKPCPIKITQLKEAGVMGAALFVFDKSA